MVSKLFEGSSKSAYTQLEYMKMYSLTGVNCDGRILSHPLSHSLFTELSKARFAYCNWRSGLVQRDRIHEWSVQSAVKRSTSTNHKYTRYRQANRPAMSAFSKSFEATLAKCTCEQINHPGKTCLWFLGRNLRCVMPGCATYFLPLILVMRCLLLRYREREHI